MLLANVVLGKHPQARCPSQVATLFSGALPGAPARWRQRLCSVEEDGSCSATSARLAALDLVDEEWDMFATAIAELALQREKASKQNFGHFQQWLQFHGAHDAGDGWSWLCD